MLITPVRSRSRRLVTVLAVGAAALTASVVTATVTAPGRVLALPGASESTTVTVEPTRVLDTRVDVGLTGKIVGNTPRKLQITGVIETYIDSTKTRTNKTVVPTGATGVLMNVTAVSPTGTGFLSVRPGDATGIPATASLTFTPGDIVPNAVTVALPATGTHAGQIDLHYGTAAGNTMDVVIDIVGYTTNTGLIDLVNRVTALETSGVAGPRGFSAWDPIPSGVTVDGYVNWNGDQSVNDNEFFFYTVDFPAVLPAAPTLVSFAPDAVSITVNHDPTCLGTLTAPTAPPGKVCVYYGGSSRIDNISVAPGPNDFAALRTFGVTYENEGAGFSTYLYFSWAYTAP